MIGQETVNEFNTGGSHRVNKHRGIPIGGDNRVEEDETSVEFEDGKYIFSNKVFTNNIEEDFPIKLPEDLSFAEASEYIGNQFKEGGKIDADTELEVLIALRFAQDTERDRLGITVVNNEFAGGSKVGQVQNRMDAVDKTLNAAQVGALALNVVPGVGNVASAAISGGIQLAKLGNKVIGGSILGKAQAEEQHNEEAVFAQQEKTSALSTTVFLNGGLVSEGSQIPQDTTRTDSVLASKYLKALPSDTLRQESTTPIPFLNITPQDTTSTGNIKEFEFGTGRGGTGGGTGTTTVTADDGFFAGLKDNIGTEGIIGLGTQLAVGLGSSIAGLASTKRSDPVPRYDIAQERNPNKLYTDEIRRSIIRNQATQIQALANRSGGNFGQFASNAAAVSNAGSNAIGQSFIQQQQLNNAEALRTDQFNFRQRAIQARSDRTADDLDAQNEGAYQNQRNAYRDAIFANIGSFGETLTNIGTGNQYLEELMINARARAVTPNK